MPFAVSAQCNYKHELASCYNLKSLTWVAVNLDFFDGRNSLHDINAPLHGVIYLIFEEQVCEGCFVTPPCRSDGAEMIECVDCEGKFFGHSCFVNHKSAGSYKKNNRKVCDVVRLCENCLKIVNTHHDQHQCGISFCKQCSKRHTFNDACFMQPVGGRKNLKENKKFLYIFYDFETR